MSARTRTSIHEHDLQRLENSTLLLSSSFHFHQPASTMAVRAHYPSNLLFHTRDESEMNDGEMNMNYTPPLFDQSHLFFSSNGENINRWKRAKEARPSATPSQQQILPFVSTGLHLALADQTNSRIKEEQPDSLISSFSEEIATLINKQDNEIDQFIIAQTEQLRRELAKRRQRHYCTLLESAGKKLLEKEAEIERAGRCITELENRLNRLQTESMAWQAKAMAEHAAAASLHSQLQKAAVQAAAAAAPPSFKDQCGGSPAEDAESVYVDPNRSDKPDRPCRSCDRRPAVVVLLPCCHLCLCVPCDFVSSVGDPCPACGVFRTGSLQVSFA